MPDPVVVELASAEAAVQAARRLRKLGYERLDALTPFPIPELEGALGVRRSRLPLLVLGAGLAGAALAFLVIWWTNARDYPIDVGGRPLDSLPTDVPIMFELMVLSAALAAFGSALVLSGLPRLHHPLFEVEGFERTSVDRFWILVEAAAEEIPSLSSELADLDPVAVRAARMP